MPDDEETTVRRRLARLFGGADTEAAVPPVTDVRAAASQRWPPPSPPEQGAGLRAGFPEREHRFAPEPARAEPDAGVHDAPATERGLASRLPGPGAFDPGRRGVRALAAVAAVVVVVAAVWAWRARPSAEPVQPVAASAEAPVSTATEAVPGVPVPAGSPGQVVVALAGKVRRPGLVRLPAGARVADAIEAAGGALPGVDVALLNPARKVTDGELILVGVTAPPGQAVPGPATGGGAPGGSAAPAGPVNLNTATLAQLDALPGVGPVLAQRILDHRDRNGGFRSVSDLRQVDGIGDARYEQLKELVTV
ncbi:helix-hairpin-helix domain-containing protein [Micromonospora marina]|uniref:Competence protein ComEA n=1 Tax=Micromonospora marina TaxID=307120 RepID=A0A1C4ZSF9_9ACTN|nr:ComEA family DNA-binding protein [Micromonospora marina]SCF35977.1 competence protein ComEA [Micromonospora marina]